MMGIKNRVGKFAHPALLILVLGAMYAFTVGGIPQGGPTDADFDWEAPALIADKPILPADSFPRHTLTEVGESVASIAESTAIENNQLAEAASEPRKQPGQDVPDLVQANIGGPTIEDLQTEVAAPKPEVHTHTVRLGETLTDIARAYDIDVDTIIAANSIPDPNRIRSGDTLDVPNVRGVLHDVKRGESLWNIARFYEVSVDEIIEANELPNPNSLQVGQRLLVPGAQALVSLRQSEAIVSASGQLLRNFSWPATGRISSRFGPRWGRMHNGLDLAIVSGTPVRASAAGRVTFSGNQGSYGLLVIIDHGNGVETRYAHNSRLVARVGQRVARGDVISHSGNTGVSTGPHLHFEIRRNGVALDPLDFLR